MTNPFSIKSHVNDTVCNTIAIDEIYAQVLPLNFYRTNAQNVRRISRIIGRRVFTLAISCLIFLLCGRVIAEQPAILGLERWTPEQANLWYAKQPWLVGANFVPSTAINQLEMWQAETFDPTTIDRELGYAQNIGMNTMRVFLHDIPWREDPQGFYSRVDKYLEIADRHGIKTLFVIFDSV